MIIEVLYETPEKAALYNVSRLSEKIGAHWTEPGYSARAQNRADA